MGQRRIPTVITFLLVITYAFTLVNAAEKQGEAVIPKPPLFFLAYSPVGGLASRQEVDDVAKALEAAGVSKDRVAFFATPLKQFAKLLSAAFDVKRVKGITQIEKEAKGGEPVVIVIEEKLSDAEWTAVKSFVNNPKCDLLVFLQSYACVKREYDDSRVRKVTFRSASGVGAALFDQLGVKCANGIVLDTENKAGMKIMKMRGKQMEIVAIEEPWTFSAPVEGAGQWLTISAASGLQLGDVPTNSVKGTTHRIICKSSDRSFLLELKDDTTVVDLQKLQGDTEKREAFPLVIEIRVSMEEAVHRILLVATSSIIQDHMVTLSEHKRFVQYLCEYLNQRRRPNAAK